MALSRPRRYEAVNYWPGFVDALSTMLLVIIFLLSVFMLAQFFLSQEVSGKDEALAKLNRQIEELTNLLALERSQKGADEARISVLTATLGAARVGEREVLALGREVGWDTLEAYVSDWFDYSEKRMVAGGVSKASVVSSCGTSPISARAMR